MKKRYEVLHPTPIRVNTVLRQPGEQFDEESTENGIPALLASGYIRLVAPTTKVME